jgi:hypothetical protein
MPEGLTTYDAAPFLAVLTAVRDAGRQARTDGAPLDDQLVVLAYRAHAVLSWLDADGAGDIESAARWLDVVYARDSANGE